jgi:prepilin-type N-terminal cleavage/methylation domain-containing protein
LFPTSRNRPRSSQAKGFTFIELLVGIAIGALLLAALYATFFTVTGATGSVETTLGARLEAGRLLDRLGGEIRSASFGKDDRFTFFAGAQKGMNSELVFTAYMRTYASGSVPGADLVSLRYAVESVSGVLSLVREVWSPYIGERTTLAVIEEIEAFEVSFFNGSKWSKAWDASLEGSLPVAVKAAVVLSGGVRLEMLARSMARPF